MNKDNILMWVMILFIGIILYKLYIDSDYFQLKCIVSTVDGDKYCVRERKNMKEATDLLAKTTVKMKKLVDYVCCNLQFHILQHLLLLSIKI